MRTIIAGSRSCTDYGELLRAVENAPWEISTVLSGTARGADMLGEKYANSRCDIQLERYPADWNKHGKSAGYIRNSTMANNAEALLALWDGKSKGTRHMIDTAVRKNLLVYVHLVAAS